MTIEDMADKFLKTEKKAHKFVKRVSFVAGANAVLKEISKLLPNVPADVLLGCGTAGEIVLNIRDKINELKGE